MRKRYFYSLLIVAILLSGCFKKYVPPPKHKKRSKNIEKLIKTRNIKKNIKTSKSSGISKNAETFDNIPEAITSIANQLLENIPYNMQTNNKIILTSFVYLDNFSKTNSLGRLLSEALIDELFIRKFKVLDYRMQLVVNVNRDGEFILSRDITKLTDEVPNSLVLVGTYSKISDKEIFINARILNNYTFEIVSTAKIILEVSNCNIINSCEKIEAFKIEQDNCSGKLCY